ncbi:MAG TPA: hypothetical protein VF810_03990 [Patescibacteria group bacterium]
MEETQTKHNLFWIILAVFSAIPVLLVLFLIDPGKAPLLILVILYAFIFLFFFSLFTLILSFVHRRHNSMAVKREAGLIGIFVVGLLILSSQQVLSSWITAIFVLSLMLIEIFFLI